MNYIHKTYNALGTTPYDRIIKLLGRNYNELVRNFENHFGFVGGRVARALANNKQDELYATFEIFKKRCRKRKARKIYAPMVLLKLIQKDLDSLISLQFHHHQNSHGFVPGRSTRTAAEQIQKIPNLIEKQTTNVDIAGAFPAITGRVVRSLLRHKMTQNSHELSNWLINILAKIATTSNDRLATGAPSSPVIFNWRLSSLDRELERETAKRNWNFTRYADDVTIVHYRGQKKHAIRLVTRLLKKLDLGIAREKLKTCYKMQKALLGLVVNSMTIEIPRKLRRVMRSLAYKLGLKNFICKNKFALDDAYKIIESVDSERSWKKGTIEAQLVGFSAYVIHAKRKIVPEVQNSDWTTKVDEPVTKWFTDDYFCFLDERPVS